MKTLRDEMAMAALTMLHSYEIRSLVSGEDTMSPERIVKIIAIRAYQIADEMMKVRDV